MASAAGNHGSSSPLEEDDGRNGNESRMSQQFRALRALIPHTATGINKRAILEDTERYLEEIHDEISRLTRELSLQSRNERPQIVFVETYLLRTRRFLVRIGWRPTSSGGPSGGVVRIQRMLESLGLDLNSVTIHPSQHTGQMLTTAFVKVKKEQASTTEEELRDLVMDAARRSGLLS